MKVYFYDLGKNLGSISDVNKANYVYICVPTPYYKNKGYDNSLVEGSISALKRNKVVIIKSTIAPGTTEKLQKKFPQHKILYNPEFLSEATAEQDMFFPDRQIIGYTQKSYNVAKEIMLQLPLAPMEKIVPATIAELIKYFGNTWFATKVTFANQMYDLCQKLGVDYELVMEGISADKRIGRTHLKIWHNGYRGYGGKCLPKDSKTLIKLAEEKGINLSVLKAANDYNDKLLKKQGLDPLNTDKNVKKEKDNDPEWISGGDLDKRLYP
jgi:UDPglucose 6-dehydrogenase